MKTIGLLGGMSWESTQTYYKLINEGVRERAGGLHSASLAMVSLDFQPLADFQAEGNWDAIRDELVSAATQVQAAGADCLLIGTNTMHKLADEVEAALHIPLIHIADATGAALVAKGIQQVGLLGTAFTMEQDFYRQRLADKFGLEVLIPTAEQRAEVHRVIYQELCQGKVLESSRASYLAVMDSLVERGAQGVILGCTEIGLLVKPQHTGIPLFDTAAIHAAAAVDFAFSTSGCA